LRAGRAAHPPPSWRETGDLRLEHEGALASWALPRGFSESPEDDLPAARTEDHPLSHLDFG
jgi:bifunctional non-homologous end joining protein LigD